MRQAAFGLNALLLALFITGCATHPTADVNAFAENSANNSFEVFNRRVQSPDALVLPVVHDRQTEGPSCGAHALASVVNYWRGSDTVNGSALYRAKPPLSPSGYSIAELMVLAQDEGLAASAVRLTDADIIHELESGRPVIVPVQLPSIYVQQAGMPGGDIPVIGTARNALMNRAARVSEWSKLMLVNHYLLVVGYDHDTFVVVEPVMGYRTIRQNRFNRFRRPFADAAIVFSGPPRATQAAAPAPAHAPSAH